MVESGSSAAPGLQESVGRPPFVAGLRDKCRAWLRRLSEDRFALCAALLVLVGLWLRVRGMSGSNIPLWSDEATWAGRLLRGREYYAFRPIGFMLASSGLVKVLGCSEFVLRFLPWIAGLLTTILAVPLSGALFKSPAARLLFIACIALNPAAIDLSKEFKPYSLALLVHEATLLFALRYWREQRARHLWLASGVAMLGVLFSQDALFAYPGLFLALGLSALRTRNRRHLGFVLSCATAAFALLLTLYLTSWRYLGAGPSGGADQHWGRRYDVFFLGETFAQRLLWLAHRYGDIAGFPGVRRSQWAESHALIAQIDYVVWAVLHVLGLIVLVVRRRLRDSLLLIVPLFTLIVFNWFGYWPLGAFRTNLFTLIYAAGIASLAFDSGAFERYRVLFFVPATLVVFLPLIAFERTWHRDKEAISFTAPSYLPQAIEAAIALQGPDFSGPPDSLVIDSSGCAAFKYYTQIHPDHQLLSNRLARRFATRCIGRPGHALATVRTLLAQGERRVWLIFSDGRALDSIQDQLSRWRLTAVTSQTVGDGGLVACIAREPRRRRAQR
jgi:hypothetical protein